MHSRQHGLTLVETLVALAILSAVVISAYAMIAQSARFAAAERDRLIGGIVADNHAAAALLRLAPPDLGEEEITVDAGGRQWTVRQVVVEANNDLLRIEISVTRAGDAQLIARIGTLRAKQ